MPAHPAEGSLAPAGWPRVVQGGMGVAVSGWRLAASVARTGQLGVVSGTALAVVLARALARWAATPAEDVVRYLLAPAPTEGDR